MIKEVRAEAVQELRTAVKRAGIKLDIHSVVPANPAPPALILGEADDFVSKDGCSFGEYAISFDGLIIVATRPADRAGELAELDKIISALLVETEASLAPQIRGYAPITIGNSQPILSARITFTLIAQIEEKNNG